MTELKAIIQQLKQPQFASVIVAYDHKDSFTFGDNDELVKIMRKALNHGHSLSHIISAAQTTDADKNTLNQLKSIFGI